jgi:hypothetical protein
MTNINWQKETINITDEEKNALMLLTQKSKKTKHAILREAVLRELNPIMKPNDLYEGQGIPVFGNHFFKYNEDSDNYTWQIDAGKNGILVIADNITPTFVKNLHNSIKKAIESRELQIQKAPRGKIRIPKSVSKYKVK